MYCQEVMKFGPNIFKNDARGLETMGTNIQNALIWAQNLFSHIKYASAETSTPKDGYNPFMQLISNATRCYVMLAAENYKWQIGAIGAPETLRECSFLLIQNQLWALQNHRVSQCNQRIHFFGATLSKIIHCLARSCSRRSEVRYWAYFGYARLSKDYINTGHTARIS